MKLNNLLPLIGDSPPLTALFRKLEDAETPLEAAIPDAAKPALVAASQGQRTAQVLVLTANIAAAEMLTEEISAWLDGAGIVLPFPEHDRPPYERLAPDESDTAQRLRVLHRLGSSQAAIFVASLKAVSQPTLTPQELAASSMEIRQGGSLKTEEFLAQLLAAGYSLGPLVQRPGEASRRGGIIDLFPPTLDQPLRLELLGNEIESIRSFDPISQRSSGLLESATAGPAQEIVWGPDNVRLSEFRAKLDFSQCGEEVQARYREELEAHGGGLGHRSAYFYQPLLAQASLLDHLPNDTLVFCDRFAELASAYEELDRQSAAMREELEQKGEVPTGMPSPYLSWTKLAQDIGRFKRQLHFTRWETPEDEAGLSFRAVPAFGGQLRRLVTETAAAAREKRLVVLVSQQAPRLRELFAEDDIAVSMDRGTALEGGGIALVHGSLQGGWRLADVAFDVSVLTDREIFGFSKQPRAQPRKGTNRAAFLADLSLGDYIVHVEHGIGVFAGLVQRTANDTQREYLEIRYADGDKLFVPSEQIDRVSRYVGPADHQPQLTRLHSGEWQRTKQRIRKATAGLAQDLLSLYAARETAQGHSFAPDTPWQLELEASFPYIETQDQLGAIAEVKQDMEAPRPMDRLVCGDVGYGKTEVALRAAFKAVLDGKQVAILVPTTVLAQQHFNTFRQRLGVFPLKVEMLSRFRSDSEQRFVTQGLEDGSIDIVIGTHRLLQKDVVFNDLGLVIIDEEQRFGVAHKEYLKRLRREVDVLTLSATPIPRTLHLALGGIRDISTVETPPEERLPVKTYVSTFDEHLAREAISRELERGGQVYFVHNRVHNIRLIAAQVASLAPEAEVAIAHGQMDEGELERVMVEFVEGRIDVLVCTTIIESGLDIPNVNTIIINQAHRLGLSQLYQLRGRVGRGAHRAYAYLFYDDGSRLTEAAQKRLQTIFEATELGSGFQIALRDLEIRGAGNLLGGEQSGHMAAVGFDLYIRLLEEAVNRLRAMRRGEPAPPPDVSIDLPLSAHIPPSYVEDINVRLALYRRLQGISSQGALSEMARELEDRLGPPPPAVQNILTVVALRLLAQEAGVRSLARQDSQIVLRLVEGRTLPPSLGTAARAGEVTLGRTTARIQASPGWEQRLRRLLQAITSANAAGV